jgi:hypothetical protein
LEVLAGSLTQLERLELAGCESVSNVGLAHLSRMPLRYLDLTGCRRVATLHRIELPFIETLLLGHTRVLDNALAVLGTMTSLTSLSLENTGIRSSLNHLARLPLRKLDISETKVVGTATAALAAVTTLQELDLSLCEITWQGMLFLSTLADLKHLKLDSRVVDDLSIRPLQALTKLESLDLFSSR